MAIRSPYDQQPDKAFWSRSVSSNYDASQLISSDEKLLKLSDKVVSAGSCFASNLIPYIEKAGITYIRTEKIPAIFANLGENLGYANFSAAYGNIYTGRQLLQLYQRAIGEFVPEELFWVEPNRIVDPFRPGLKFAAESLEEFKLINEYHLRQVKLAFETADVFVFTLGLTEGWISNLDGAVFPACPGTIAGKFEPKIHEFKNFTVSEIVSDINLFIEKLRKNNKKVRFILSVSPVPLVATATPDHVLRATTYSKSVLRVAAQEIVNANSNVTYFPAYEIITGIPAPKNFFESDLRNVSQEGVELVMNTLLTASDLNSGLTNKVKTFLRNSNKSKNDKINVDELSAKIATADCDEVMQDRNLID